MLKGLIKNLLSRRKEPELLFTDSTIFYNYVFDLGRSVNPIEVAREILGASYSIALANYVTDSVEFSDVFKGSLNIREQATHFSDLSKTLKSERLGNAAMWMVRHPKQTVNLVRVLRRARKEKKENERKSPPDVDSKEKSEEETELESVIEELDRRMAHFQTLAALHNFSDRRLFSDLYLADLPFVRVELQSIDATFAGHEHGIDVDLLIHRTGVAILTFYVMLPHNKTVNDLINLKVLSGIEVTKVRVPDALMGTAAIATGLANPKDVKRVLYNQTKSGEPGYYEFEMTGEDDRRTLGDIFDWYRMTILSTVLKKEPVQPEEFWAKLRSPDWHAYPIFFIKGVPPECKTAKYFKKKYPQQLAGILTANKKWDELPKTVIENTTADEQSLSENLSFYIGLSHTTVIYYSNYKRGLEQRFGKDIPGQEWIFDHFQRSGLVDVLLIQRWILHILSMELRTLPISLPALNSLKRSLLLALSEHQDITVSYGTARDIIKHGHDKLEINDTLEAIKFQLSNLEKLIDVEESRRRYRRDLFLRLVATVGTLLFGLSGARQVVNVLSGWSPPLWLSKLGIVGELLNGVFMLIHEHQNYSTLIIYLLLILIMLPAMLWSVWQRAPKKPIISYDQSAAAHRPGFTWPVGLKFHDDDKDKNT